MPAFAGFQHGRTETLGANVGTSIGTTVTAGAVNTKGSWVSLGQTTFGYDWFNLLMAQTAASDKLVDIGVSADGSTNWYPIATNLRFAGLKSADIILAYALPLRIRSGAFVGLRIAASTASHVLIATLMGSSAGPKGLTGYSRCVPLFTPTGSRGTAIDPGGTANTKSAWVQLDASTEASVDTVYVCVAQNADVTRTAVATALFDIGVGSAGNEFPMLENLSLRWTTTPDGPQITFGPIPCYIPAGSRLAARAQCTDITAGDRTMDIAVLGFVP